MYRQGIIIVLFLTGWSLGHRKNSENPETKFVNSVEDSNAWLSPVGLGAGDKFNDGLEKEFLHMLHLNAIPSVQEKQASDYMEALYNTLEESNTRSWTKPAGKDGVKEKVIVGILPVAVALKRAGLQVLYKSGNLPQDQGPVYAELVLKRKGTFMKKLRDNVSAKLTFSVDRRPYVTTKIRSDRQIFGKAIYDVFNVTSMFSDLNRLDSAPVHVRLQLEEPTGRKVRKYYYLHQFRDQPILVLYYGINSIRAQDGDRFKRSRRSHRPSRLTSAFSSHNSSDPSVDENRCRLHEWYLSFQSLHWDWVLAPVGFYPNYCTGNCPPPLLNPVYHASNHALLRSLYRTSDTGEPKPVPEVPPPCCVPTRLTSLHILYRDEYNHILLRLLENIVASECGCQ